MRKSVLPSSPTPQDSPDQSTGPEQEGLSALCLSCGMCCDGSLFTVVEVTKAEKHLLLPKGFRVYRNDEGDRVFDQPCARLKDRCCQIYDSRPHPCRTFECYLVAEIRANETDLSAAMALVRDTRKKQQWIKDSVPFSFYTALADLTDQQFDPAPVDPASVDLAALDLASVDLAALDPLVTVDAEKKPPAPTAPQNLLPQNLTPPYLPPLDLPASFRDWLYEFHEAGKAVLARRAFSSDELDWITAVHDHLTVISDRFHPKKLKKKFAKLIKKHKALLQGHV